MNSRERVRRTLTFDYSDRVPCDLWILPIGWSKYPREMRTILERYPLDIEMVMWPKPTDYYYRKFTVNGGQYGVGEYVDEWGCIIRNIQVGVMGQIKDPLVKSWADLKKIRPLYESIREKMKTATKYSKT